MALRTTTGQVRDADQDRQRARAERGVTGQAGEGASRPSPPRRRRPAVTLLGVLLIVGGAALAGLLALRMDSRDPVLVLTQDVPAGTEITRDLLGRTNVATDSDLVVPAGAIGQVLGTYAKVPLSQGQLLDTSMLVLDNPIGDGTVAEVGVPLVKGRVPDGLDSGDLVRVVRLSDNGTEGVPLALALVLRPPEESGGGGVLGGGESDTAAATLLVPVRTADAIVDAAGNNRLGLALVDRGVSVSDTNRLMDLMNR